MFRVPENENNENQQNTLENHATGNFKHLCFGRVLSYLYNIT